MMLAHACAIENNVFSGYRMPSLKTNMGRPVFKYHKVFRPIIIALFVFMVDIFQGAQIAAHYFLNGQAMFSNISLIVAPRMILSKDQYVTPLAETTSRPFCWESSPLGVGLTKQYTNLLSPGLRERAALLAEMSRGDLLFGLLRQNATLPGKAHLGFCFWGMLSPQAQTRLFDVTHGAIIPC